MQQLKLVALARAVGLHWWGLNAGFIVPLGLAHGVACHQIKGWLRLEGLWGQDTCPGGETQTRHGNNCLGLLTPGQGGQVVWEHADSLGDTRARQGHLARCRDT